MGAGASAIAKKAEAAGTKDLNLMLGVFLPLCQKTDAGKISRSAFWKNLDNNGNGTVSLAEYDAWVKSLLVEAKVNGSPEAATLVWKAFRPCYIRAFNDAKDIDGKSAAKNKKADDYVTKVEFRMLCAYTCIYCCVYDVFAKIDGGSAGVTADDDRKITAAEMKAACESGIVKDYPLAACAGFVPGADVEKIFKVMNSGVKDAAGNKSKDNVVMLIEFCAYCEALESKGNTEIGKLLAVGDELAAKRGVKGANEAAKVEKKAAAAGVA